MMPFVPKSVIHPELSYLNKEYLLPPGMGRSEAIEKRIREAGITRKIRDDQAKFRLCCWLHAAKTVKASRYVPTKRKGYGL